MGRFAESSKYAGVIKKLKDSGNLSDKDLKVVTELLNDLRKALEEKG